MVVFNHRVEDLGICLRRVGDAHFREAVSEGISGEAESAGSLALIPVSAAERFADGFIFPLFEGHAFGQDVLPGAGSPIARGGRAATGPPL